MPFLNHWYVGVVPPFVPVAVKVTVVPEHTLIAEEAMLTLGVNVPLTIIVIPVEVAEVPDKQVGNVPPAVCLAVITSPFVGM